MLLSLILFHFLSCQEGCYTILALLCLSQHGWSTHYCLVVWQILCSPEINHADPRQQCRKQGQQTAIKLTALLIRSSSFRQDMKYMKIP